MRRIDDRTVEFTDDEMEVKARFDELLDDGLGIPQAAVQALTEHWRFGRPPGYRERDKRKAFVDYLSDDTVVSLSNGGYVIKVGYRD